MNHREFDQLMSIWADHQLDKLALSGYPSSSFLGRMSQCPVGGNGFFDSKIPNGVQFTDPMVLIKSHRVQQMLDSIREDLSDVLHAAYLLKDKSFNDEYRAQACGITEVRYLELKREAIQVAIKNLRKNTKKVLHRNQAMV